MNEVDIAYLTLLIVGCYASWWGGKKTGIRGTIEYLEQQGLLEFDDTPENIS
jgi:hypothetical protein|tara:strand:+ start:490 stop:645 length:156 start_codon:yes stop_codon:yes gene_type:complete